MTITGGAVSYAPQPTPKPSTTRRKGWGENLHTGRWKPGEGIGRQSAGGVRQRSLPEESAGRTTGDQTLLEGTAD